MEKLREGEWDDSIESELGDAIAESIDDFGPDFDAEGNPIEEGESERIVTREERERERTEADRAGAEGDGGEPGGDESEAESEQQEAARA